MDLENKNSFFYWFKNSITIKLISIIFIVLILLVPQNLIISLINERQNTMEQAVSEIASTWGYAQTIAGPVINVPYELTAKNEKGEKFITRNVAHFLPEKLDISSEIKPRKKSKAIYDAVIYEGELNLKGNFATLEIPEWQNNDVKILWNETRIIFGISDLRGISENIEIQLNNEKIELSPGIQDGEFLGNNQNKYEQYNNDYAQAVETVATPNAAQPNGLSGIVKTANSETKHYAFNFKVKFKGSKRLMITPLGKETTINMQSNWGDPSFVGAFLPEHNISKDKFTANWRILSLNRNYPQAWSNNTYFTQGSELGVELLVPASQYQQTTRSAKYAILFVMLTFLVFFFVEITYKSKVHPFQYLLVGLALSIFYLLLLSISEHLGFKMAYFIAAVSVVSLITLFTKGMIQKNFITLIMFCLLVVLYLFLYSLLILQDYSLLIGSIGLFLILAIIMYLSRKLNLFNDL